MTNATTFKAKRIAAGISGDVVCKKIGKSRGWLSTVERGYSTPTTEDLSRLDTALTQLIQAKEQMYAVAMEMGWPAAVAV
jgi:transcriptional regulator with XRE-family HTH domain